MVITASSFSISTLQTQLDMTAMNNDESGDDHASVVDDDHAIVDDNKWMD